VFSIFTVNCLPLARSQVSFLFSHLVKGVCLGGAYVRCKLPAQHSTKIHRMSAKRKNERKLRIAGFTDFAPLLEFFSTFRKVDLFSSSGEGRGTPTQQLWLVYSIIRTQNHFCPCPLRNYLEGSHKFSIVCTTVRSFIALSMAHNTYITYSSRNRKVLSKLHSRLLSRAYIPAQDISQWAY
jgi:hypothetical protein